MRIDENLIKKYSKTGPRYTSYPPATFFDDSFQILILRKKLFNQMMKIHKIYLFTFISPFALKYVIFVVVRQSQGLLNLFLERYVDAVIKEISYVSKLINKNRKLTQIHWGGGTPNAISYKYIERITKKLFKRSF